MNLTPHAFLLFLQTLSSLSLCGALFFTFAWLNRALTFYCRAMKNLDAIIPISQIIAPSVAWAIFYFLTHSMRQYETV